MVIIIKRLILKINDYITTFRFAIVQSRSFTQITLTSYSWRLIIQTLILSSVEINEKQTL